MMKRQWIVAVCGAACLVAATCLSSLADEGTGRMMRGQMQDSHDQREQEAHRAHYLKHRLKHATEIGLTSEQVGKLKALTLDFSRTQPRMEAEIKIDRLELHARLDEEQADLAAIQAKVPVRLVPGENHNPLKRGRGPLLICSGCNKEVRRC